MGEATAEGRVRARTFAEALPLASHPPMSSIATAGTRPEAFRGFTPALIEIVVKGFALVDYRPHPADADDALQGLDSFVVNPAKAFSALLEPYGRVGSFEALREMIVRAPETAFENARHAAKIVEDLAWALGEATPDGEIADMIDRVLVRVGPAILVSLLLVDRAWGAKARSFVEHVDRMLDTAFAEADRLGCSVVKVLTSPLCNWLSEFPARQVLMSNET